ncbi:LysR substrate-binding domain-containing protein [Salipiger abyssi]|uniref:LysR substrate-binding domain-containing protein n=1 Tax=Salipiger abyssi TaxID=1250539 RepID=UPI001A90C6A0|nr:LysR substrate-binding domain-containing protein [Salipiger abyssi]MBN9888160.1 LysR family transcriptional regulator [Salipiger abyssi]
MELRHLRYFVAVAEEEHITRAAQRLGIQQPPLSQQIQSLEREIGVQLLQRNPRSVKLNAAGRVFLNEARKVLSAADNAVRRVQEFDMGKEGNIRVGLTNSSSLHKKALEIIRTCRSEYPLIDFKIEEGNNHDLLVALEQEMIDAAFLRVDPEGSETVAFMGIDMEDLVVALPLGSPFADHDEIALADLREQSFIRYGQGVSLSIWPHIEAHCEQAGFHPKISEETIRILPAVHLVAAGFGVTLLPKSLETVGSTQLAFRPLRQQDRLRVPLSLAYRRHADAQAIRRFVRVAAQLSSI